MSQPPVPADLERRQVALKQDTYTQSVTVCPTYQTTRINSFRSLSSDRQTDLLIKAWVETEGKRAGPVKVESSCIFSLPFSFSCGNY